MRKKIRKAVVYGKLCTDIISNQIRKFAKYCLDCLKPPIVIKTVHREIFWELLQNICTKTVYNDKKRIALDRRHLEDAEYFLNQSDRAVLVDNFNIEITGKHIRCLEPMVWLNDEIINFYLELLSKRCKRNLQRELSPPSTKLKCHFFNTFFCTKFQNGYRYRGVKRWSKKAKIKIVEMDKVIIPVHVGHNHWCLAVINFQKKRFEFYDSLGAPGAQPSLLKDLRSYVRDEAKQYSNIPNYDLSDWIDYVPHDIPHQNNGSDCGVFTCKFADYLSENCEFDFTFEDMPDFRRRMVLEITTENIL